MRPREDQRGARAEGWLAGIGLALIGVAMGVWALWHPRFGIGNVVGALLPVVAFGSVGRPWGDRDGQVATARPSSWWSLASGVGCLLVATGAMVLARRIVPDVGAGGVGILTFLGCALIQRAVIGRCLRARRRSR